MPYPGPWGLVGETAVVEPRPTSGFDPWGPFSEQMWSSCQGRALARTFFPDCCFPICSFVWLSEMRLSVSPFHSWVRGRMVPGEVSLTTCSVATSQGSFCPLLVPTDQEA